MPMIRIPVVIVTEPGTSNSGHRYPIGTIGWAETYQRDPISYNIYTTPGDKVQVKNPKGESFSVYKEDVALVGERDDLEKLTAVFDTHQERLRETALLVQGIMPIPDNVQKAFDTFLSIIPGGVELKGVARLKACQAYWAGPRV